MYKKFLKKVLLLLLILLVSITLSNCAYSSKEKGGYFKKLHSNLPVDGGYQKLKDGRVLIYAGEAGNIIFDPKTDTFRKTAKAKKGIELTSSAALADGRVLFVGPYAIHAPTDELDLYSLVADDLFKKRLKKYRIVESTLTDSEIRELSRQVYLEEYASLYEDEREKLLLPYLKKNPELMKKYNDCVAEYEQSMHGQIYDPVTETFEYTKGKLNIRRFDTTLVLLKNGNVLIMGGQTPRDRKIPIGIADEGMSTRAGRMEIYNPETETFSLVNNTTPIYNVVDAFLLKDGRVFIIYSGKYTIYDPEKNIFSETGRLIKYKQHLKLSDDKILFFVGSDTTFETFKLPKHSHNHQSYLYYFKEYNISEIVIYDINKKEYKDGGHLLIPRGGSDQFTFGLIELKDGNILVFGGEDKAEERKLGDTVLEKKDAEIYNPKTGISKVIKKMNYGRVNDEAILLDDGRVLLYCGNHSIAKDIELKNIELYIPEK